MLTLAISNFRVSCFVLLSAILVGCGSKTAPVAPAGPVPAAKSEPTDPKSTIAHQLELLKAGDVAGLKATMTERQREGITQEVVDKGKAQAAKSTIDDLVGSVEPGTDGAAKTVKIKMKNGRTLTTLIEVDGKWLADTIWFK